MGFVWPRESFFETGLGEAILDLRLGAEADLGVPETLLAVLEPEVFEGRIED